MDERSRADRDIQRIATGAGATRTEQAAAVTTEARPAPTTAATADVAGPTGVAADTRTCAAPGDQGAPATRQPRAAPSAATAYDPGDAQTLALLTRRTASGGYAVADVDLVRAIRLWNARAQADDAAGDQRQRGQRASAITQRLCELLIDRCMPEFQRRAGGLRHRPDLMQDAIQGMIEQLLREALNPSEEFMTLNFIHYLRCLCADNFGRVLRQEGLSYRRDAQGRPAGRPQHVPRALIETIDISAEDRDDPAAQSRTIADPRDTITERMASLEAQRILNYLPDPLDQRIMILRVFEQLRWDDIAEICGKTERTMRLRFEKARVKLRECIEAEAVVSA